MAYNGFAIDTYLDAEAVNKELDALIQKPVYTIRREKLKDYVQTLEGVILFNHSANSYWPAGSEYDDNTPPQCQSVDGKVGYGDPGGICEACDYNKFGSDPNEVVIGAVGQLQFEVFEYRLKNEYNAQVRMDRLDFSTARWVQIDADPSSRDYVAALEKIKDVLDSRTMLVFDHFERPIILFANQFTLQYFCEKHKDIKLVEALDVQNQY